ncbi:gamma-glutamyl-gamma-aminobutyrate hydrolase family protein [Amycolatopsis endophytica]|uniref:Putative glutamine amidotransferase n=1 Tax=Amycolatopsis endophytica TaxID=860233 RepID=A0A853BFQ2_9PSEU|nr:gamma-glutamyl-gamma-aminobutyrate hydrolase family protein [Amycolatopsis endophytica]NYI93346.1 putative glutamine amidotransferase [Amycolatopsis endophytica]
MSGLLAVTQRLLSADEHGEVRLALDVRWWSFLAACGFDGVPMPLDPSAAAKLLSRTGCRGLVLTGGNDVGSAPERDVLERYLLRWAADRGLPVIGVCRGMQLMLATFGACLEPVRGHVAVEHRLTGPHGGRTVNSYHDWAVLEAPREFAVTARCGRVVEAVRHRELPMAGIMWHPERTDPVQREDVELFGEVFGGRDASGDPGRGTRVAHGRGDGGPAQVPGRAGGPHAA